jgi:hypothetical protein
VESRPGLRFAPSGLRGFRRTTSRLDSPRPNPEKARQVSPKAPEEIRCPCPHSNPPSTPPSTARDGVSTSTKGEVREAVDHALELLDKGETRVAERGADGKWKVNQWLKKAVLLSFRLNDMSAIPGGPGQGRVVGQGARRSSRAGARTVFAMQDFRAVPGAIVRRSAFIARNVVLMPSFVNLGAYVDEATMIDTWSDRRLLRADRQARAYFRRRRHRRRARAAAGRARDHRGRLLHRRALGSGRKA